MPSYLSSLFQGKCPRCRRGDIYKYPIWRYDKMTAMYDQCQRCGQSFMPEPGFYYLAMYMSYAINVAIAVTCWIVLSVFLEPDSLQAYFLYFLMPITLLIILLIPVILRLSRNTMLYWAGGISYDPSAANEAKE